MTKEERRAEKIRMLVQSGSLFVDAAIALAQSLDPARAIPPEQALQCVFVAHLSNEVQAIRHEIVALSAALEARK